MADLYKGKLAIVPFANLFRAGFGIVPVKTIWGFEKVKRGSHNVLNKLCRHLFFEGLKNVGRRWKNTNIDYVKSGGRREATIPNN